MYVKLTIPERLKDLRVERGLTLEQLADATGLSRSALGSYEADDYKDISPYSIVTLAGFYGVTTDYLLGVTEMKNHPDTDLTVLHLGDEMLQILASGRINNRLLSEIVTHKDFQRLMVDTEICVDRIAAMRVHDMNTVLTETRKRSWKNMTLVKKICTYAHWSWRRSMRMSISAGLSMMIWTGSSGISGKRTGRTLPLPMPSILRKRHVRRWKKL